MADLISDQPKTLKDRLPDILGFLGSVAVIGVAYMVFTDKLPKNLGVIFSYFYILAIVGVLGVLGEKAATTLLSFFLPLLLAAATLAFKFKPQQYPIEDWWEVYSILVLFSAGFVVFLFFRYEQAKLSGGGRSGSGGGGGGPLKTRVDPTAAAKYREEQEKKSAAKDNTMGDLDKKAGVKPAEPKAADAKAAAAGGKPAARPDETAEERMEREMREIKDEFSKRSMRLGTTLMRIKNLAKSLDRDQIFNNIIEIITKGLDATKVQLLINDDKEGKFRIVTAAGMKPKDYKDLEIPHEETCMITHLLHQKVNEVTGGAGALGVKECEMDPKTKGLVGQGTVKSILCAPIYAEGKMFAVINVEQMANPDYTRDDQNLLSTCADIAGLVMKNAKLYSATMADLVSAQKLSEDQLKKNEELKGSLSRIVSPSVAELIMSDPSGLKLGGSKCEVTMFFSDIRGFTKMSEGMDPTDIVEQLNVYFTRMTDILMELDGTLDKYVGDELMALFGAPVARDDDPIRAVLTGVHMLDALRELQEMWKEQGKPVISIGIGINTGIVTAGYMGSEKQLSYTVIGDNVNLAARVMSAAKPMELFITRSTYERVEPYFEITQRESIMVKGKSMPIEIFQVTGVKPDVDFSELLGKSIVHIASGIESEKPQPAQEPVPVKPPPGMKEEDMKQNIKLDQVKKIECQNCGHENDMQEKFCTKCGMPIF
ncbi:MAG: Adenylate cyclase [Candidatus Rifleibacterium amylolyticum]|nr:MAG: Adenylate cyclase [Candidatus Rifleibacterium amylolyticum]